MVESVQSPSSRLLASWLPNRCKPLSLGNLSRSHLWSNAVAAIDPYRPLIVRRQLGGRYVEPFICFQIIPRYSPSVLVHQTKGYLRLRLTLLSCLLEPNRCLRFVLPYALACLVEIANCKLCRRISFGGQCGIFL